MRSSKTSFWSIYECYLERPEEAFRRRNIERNIPTTERDSWIRTVRTQPKQIRTVRIPYRKNGEMAVFGVYGKLSPMSDTESVASALRPA